VIHTVGPIGEDEPALRSCYERVMEIALVNGIRSLALCCISTGVYGYPKRKAAHVALRTIRQWLEEDGNADKVDRIIFCMFLDEEMELYKQVMPAYFPIYEYPSLGNDD
jgi:O-acetyl-ADP-ribose deacetylase (regulator of RNase III)